MCVEMFKIYKILENKCLAFKHFLSMFELLVLFSCFILFGPNKGKFKMSFFAVSHLAFLKA